MKTSVVLFMVMFTITEVLYTSCLSSQNTNEPGFVPRMKVSGGLTSNERPVLISELKIDIRIIGSIATTTSELTFLNPNYRALEGEFEFPLTKSQTVTGFSLLINNEWHEAAVVEKGEARRTYEAIVRRGIDPALLEMTVSNNYKARIYPLPPQETRKVRITFQEQLSYSNNSIVYQLPLQIDYALDHFSVHAEIEKQQARLEEKINELKGFEFNKVYNATIGNFTGANYTPDKMLAFEILQRSDKPLVFIGKTDNKTSYFYCTTLPDKIVKEKKHPSIISIYWDCSSSGLQRDIKKEIAFLEAYLVKLQNVKVEFIPFNINVSKSQLFNILNGNCNSLKLAIEKIYYDGATSLGCIDFTKSRTDEIFLFSDGISNFNDPNPIIPAIPVITVNTASKCNYSYLEYLSMRTGGRYIDLLKLKAEEALSKISSQDYRFISASYNRNQIFDVYPSGASSFDKEFSIAGKVKGENAELILNFGIGNTILHRDTIRMVKISILMMSL